MQAADFFAASENVGETEKELLLTAALFHDTGFVKIREEHEEESCIIACDYLPSYGYTPGEIEVICGLIKATRVPQSPKTELAEILCDADLDYLGRDDFFALSDRLFTELQSEGLLKNLNEWNRQQAEFMGNHRYFTQTAVSLRQLIKAEHIDLIRLKITSQILDENH
jgi:uncharacterized protein